MSGQFYWSQVTGQDDRQRSVQRHNMLSRYVARIGPDVFSAQEMLGVLRVVDRYEAKNRTATYAEPNQTVSPQIYQNVTRVTANISQSYGTRGLILA